MGGDPGGGGGAPPPLEFVWDRFFFEFAINPSLPPHFAPPPVTPWHYKKSPRMPMTLYDVSYKDIHGSFNKTPLNKANNWFGRLKPSAIFSHRAIHFALSRIPIPKPTLHCMCYFFTSQISPQRALGSQAFPVFLWELRDAGPIRPAGPIDFASCDRSHAQTPGFIKHYIVPRFNRHRYHAGLKGQPNIMHARPNTLRFYRENGKASLRHVEVIRAWS